MTEVCRFDESGPDALPRPGAWWSGTVAAFMATSDAAVLGQLSYAATQNFRINEGVQLRARLIQVGMLRAAVSVVPDFDQQILGGWKPMRSTGRIFMRDREVRRFILFWLLHADARSQPGLIRDRATRYGKPAKPIETRKGEHAAYRPVPSIIDAACARDVRASDALEQVATPGPGTRLCRPLQGR